MINPEFFVENDVIDSCNRVFAEFSIDELIEKCVDESMKSYCKENDFSFYGSGWQSWGFGGELDEGEYQTKYFPIVPQWKQYFTFPGTEPKTVLGKSSKSKELLTGCFLIYLRWGKTYLVIASVGNVDNVLPPVKFYVNRKSRKIACTVYSDGKKWRKNDLISKLAIFSESNFFELQKTIKELYAKDWNKRFNRLQFLNTNISNKTVIGGWESWYNHYADINQKLIDEDLQNLGTTNNLIKTYFLNKNKPCVFQVDDGWEQGLGQWEADLSRFPQGMTNLASSISEKGYIPGLWVAPLIIDLRTNVAKEHPEWILKDKKGKPIAAGFNPLWGANFGKYQPSFPGSYFVLDLSIDEVIEYLDALMEKVVNEWGFRYIKLDFLFAGMIYGNFKNKGSAYEWYNRAIKVLTKRNINKKGEKVAYLGCGLPFESSFNDFPLSRIGPDTKEDWDVPYLRRVHFPSRTSAFLNMQSTLGHSFWDQGIYINDPDVVFLRYENISLNDKEKILIALVNFLFASQVMHSDDPVKFNKNTEGKFTEKIACLYERFGNENFGLLNKTSKSYFIFSQNKKYIGFINLDEKDMTIKKEEFLDICEIEKSKELEKIIDYAKIEKDNFSFENHSISIFEVK